MPKTSLNVVFILMQRSGRKQLQDTNKITQRLEVLALGLDNVDVADLQRRVVLGLYDGVATCQIDELSAETAAALASKHPNWGTLAARIVVSNLHKSTPGRFSEAIRTLHDKVSDDVRSFVAAHAEALDAAIRDQADYEYTYFGLRTLMRGYLLAGAHGRLVERPQYMLMRVAVGIHGCAPKDRDAQGGKDTQGLARALETYELLSARMFTHATPTLFNAGTPRAQMASCFLLPVAADSVEGIYETLGQCARISKGAGGIGLSISNVRAAGSRIGRTAGVSGGIVPMLRVFNDAARHISQGDGKRKGGIAVYLEPWHADVLDFLELRKNSGKEEARTRDLFTGMWVCDLFMRRVEADEPWTLMCPDECPGLVDAWGPAFDALYAEHEAAGRGRRTVQARQVWVAILNSQLETGTPYMLYKDTCNRMSNHAHLGTTRASNLCTEIIQYSSATETAVCNLASLALPRFVDAEAKTFDHGRFARVVAVATRNLNRIIDVNAYPTQAARLSNLRHRPLGLGVQGLADVFMLLRLAFDSPAARALSREIFETLYFAALDESCNLAAEAGAPYESYAGSPLSRGVLHFDHVPGTLLSGRHDWAGLRARLAKHGAMNSLLVAPMPTATTSQILGFNECIEPYTSNIYVRRVLSGEFVVVNPHLVRELLALGLWTDATKDRLIADGGSVQAVPGVPDDVKLIFRTVWEIKQRSLIEMAADRAPFVDQSQSLNLYLPQPDPGKLAAMHMLGWRLGLKTGMYYFRTKPATEAIKFTLAPNPQTCESCNA